MVIRPDSLQVFKDILKPYFAVWLPYMVTLIITWPIQKYHRVIKTLKKISSPNTFSEPLLCLEAGEKGWEIIEYKELYQSALEYIGEERLVRFVVKPNEPYLKQLVQFLDENPNITHYGWSPRTGEQHWFKGLVEAFKISIMLSKRGITPIAFLTDMLVRRWRAKAVIVTASKGVVVTLMSPIDVSIMCPHKRFIGPYIMPFSKKTLDHLVDMKNKSTSKKAGAVVVGALYEPRKSIIESIQEKLLESSDHQITVNGRALDGQRSSDDDYWAKMVNSNIVITTSNVMDGGLGYDWPWKEHFVYRYMEVLASGSLLAAPNLPGLELYFTEGEHFIGFSTEQEAAEKVQYYLENEDEAIKISNKGFERAKSFVESRSFWLSIDIFLSKDGLMQ